MIAAPKPQDDVQAQAREWFVRLLDEQLPPEEVAAWELWLRADPEHAAAFDRLSELWCSAGGIGPAAATPEQLRADSYDGSGSIKQWLRRPLRLTLAWSSGAVVAVGLAVGLAWVLHSPSAPMDSRKIITARAEQAQATLADGSTITVGGRSRLDVLFNRKQRALSLVEGEALFHVAHERTRPFVVHTPLGDVTAVGTAFDVDVGSRTVVLTVSEGVVSVELPVLRVAATEQGAQPLKVSAGQKLLLEPDGVHLVRMPQGEPAASTWSDGRIEYRDAPLRMVLDDINRYAQRPIVLADSSLGDLAYTGAVQLTNTLVWDKGLEGAFQIVADTSDDRKITLRRKGSDARYQ